MADGCSGIQRSAKETFPELAAASLLPRGMLLPPADLQGAQLPPRRFLGAALLGHQSRTLIASLRRGHARSATQDSPRARACGSAAASAFALLRVDTPALSRRTCGAIAFDLAEIGL